MEPTVINATDLRIKTREIMERVKFKGECFLVQTFGQPTAMIISVEDFENLKEGISSFEKQSLEEANVSVAQDKLEGDHFESTGSDTDMGKT